MPFIQTTIVVVARERFSPAAACFEHLVCETATGVQWVYVDNGLPQDIRSQLDNVAPVEWVTAPRYASPNQARNAGLAIARGKYVVFIDNDVMVAPGWLEPLVRCADETGACIVGPLYMIGDQVHMAGGALRFEEGPGGRILLEEHQHADCRLDQLQLSRSKCDYVEFHCMLIRRDSVGSLNEDMLSLHEHLDLSLSVRERGGDIYMEPASQVTYLTPPPFEIVDVPFFTLRWCEAWNSASTLSFKARWQVVSIPTEEDELEADTSTEWARGHRRRLAGTAWQATSLSEMEHLAWIVAAFMAVDCQYFEVADQGGLEVRSGHELLNGSVPVERLRPCPQPGGPHLCTGAPDNLAFLVVATDSGPQSWAAVLQGPRLQMPWIEIREPGSGGYARTGRHRFPVASSGRLMFVAQTNLQLYGQLEPAQTPGGAAAYELATQLFTGQFRASGKSFLAHLVGTASILAGLGRPLEEITAGLLHAAYPNGDFGAAAKGRRDEVRKVIGEVAESYLESYANLPWEPDRYPSSDSPVELAVLRIRVANELEDVLDGALAWVSPERGRKMLSRLEPTARLAERLQLPTLAEALRAVPAPPPGKGPDRSFALVPRTYARVAEIVAKRLRDGV